MSNSGFGTDPNIPPPGYQGTVWPPPPVGQAQGIWYPFKTLLSRVDGTVPNFRLGSINLSPDGLYIQGKAITRYEIQVPILIVCLLLRLGFLIAYLIMEYAIRRDEVLSVPWASVRRIILVPDKNRICIVYDAPNYKGVVKTFSLATALDPALYQSFAASAEQYVPGRVSVGKLRAWTSPPVWIFLGGIVLGLAIVLIVAATGGFNSTG